MKHFYFLLSIPLCLLLLCACHHDEPEVGVDFSKMENQGKRFVAYAERDCDINEEKPWNKVPEDAYFDEQGNIAHAPRRANSLVMTDLARGILESVCTYKVHQVCGTYMSHDAYGKEIKVSGAIYYPTSGKIKNVIICSPLYSS